MSVLVKGMEMPKSCVVCKFGSFYQSTHGLYCGILTKDIKGSALCRPDWCPLVEVPAHGRLIDADALKTDMTEAMKDGRAKFSSSEAYNFAVNVTAMFFMDIVEQPTVIPAEEAANGA